MSLWWAWKRGFSHCDQASENPDELEEERRLAYGMTRAESALYLTAARRLQYVAEP